jgi:hypothetical protein
MLGETLREARHQKRWSIEQLSKSSGVPGRLIREMEGGERHIRAERGQHGGAGRGPEGGRGTLLEERERLFEQCGSEEAAQQGVRN